MKKGLEKKTGGMVCICVSDPKTSKKINNISTFRKIPTCYAAATLPLL
jgi:hypothetical protein